MLFTWVYWLLFLLCAAVGFGAFGFFKNSFARLAALAPAVVLLVNAATCTCVYTINVSSGEPDYEVAYTLPFAEPSYLYDGQRYEIGTDESYAVVNISGYYTFVLYRNGGTWPFGLYSLEPMEVIVEPGKVGYIPSSIKGKRNAHASYFSLSLKNAAR